MLFFDEADSLFGARTDVSDAHDRYANSQTNFLLQRIEEYEGVAILSRPTAATGSTPHSSAASTWSSNSRCRVAGAAAPVGLPPGRHTSGQRPPAGSPRRRSRSHGRPCPECRAGSFGAGAGGRQDD